MEFLGKHSLVAHPSTPASSGLHVTADVQRTPDKQFLAIQYAVQPARSVSLSEYGIERRDGLWKSTCFEFFIKANGGSRYREFNFAPLFAWNAYEFDDWRKGMTPLQHLREPHLVDSRIDDRAPDFPERYELDVILGPEAWSVGPAKLSLTAVIEEKDGTKSYWALAHPPGATPNFHHPHCFAAQLA